MKPTSAVLREARELLGPNGENWIKGAGALDEYGLDPEDDPEAGLAVCWCAGGAIIEAEDPRHKYYTKSRAFKLLEKVVGMDLPTWNDRRERTIADIDRAFTEAIRLAQREEQGRDQ